MNGDWQPRDTTTHQDHVIAHVIGARLLGHFVFDETLYLLLDIGFVWSIFLDCEMGLMPHPVAVNELAVAERFREQVRTDIDRLLSDTDSEEGLQQLIQTPVECHISDVSFFELDDKRRLVITGENASLAIETSLTTAEIHVYGL